MLNKTTAAPENRRPWSWYRVGAPEEHLSGSVLLRSSTRVDAPEEPGLVLLRSWLLRSRVGSSQEPPSPTYQASRITAWSPIFFERSGSCHLLSAPPTHCVGESAPTIFS